MLTTMTEEDWTIVLKLFEASRSRRGDKGRDDRKKPCIISWFTTSRRSRRLAAGLSSDRRRSQ